MPLVTDLADPGALVPVMLSPTGWARTREGGWS